MKKVCLFFLMIMIPSLVFAGGGVSVSSGVSISGGIVGGGVAAAAGCSAGLTQSASNNVMVFGAATAYYKVGMIWKTTDAGGRCICKMTFYLTSTVATTLDGTTLTAKVSNVDGSNQPISDIQSSTGISCTGGSCDAYSGTEVTFTFPTCATIAADTNYAFTVERGTVDADDYFSIGIQQSDVIANGWLARFYNGNPGYITSSATFDPKIILWW